MKTIWKFNAVVQGDDFTIDMPADAEILHAQAYASGYAIHINVWAIVTPNMETQPRLIAVRGTGHPLREVGRHIATSFDGALVWHIFEGAQKREAAAKVVDAAAPHLVGEPIGYVLALSDQGGTWLARDGAVFESAQAAADLGRWYRNIDARVVALVPVDEP